MTLDDRDEIRAAVAARYAGLARAAQAGQAITDGDPDARGAAALPRTPTPPACPRPRCGPAWAAATRSRSPTCGRVRRCWTWARAAASTCCCPPAGSAPPGKAYGLDMTDEMLDLARANAARGRSGERGVPARPDRGDPAAGRLGGRDHLQLRDQPVHRPARRLRRELPRAAPRRPPGHLRHPRRGPPHPRPAARARRRRPAASPGRLLHRVPRRAGPGRIHRDHASPRPTRSATACTRRSSARSGRDHAIPGADVRDRADDRRRTPPPCWRSTRPGSRRATPPSRPARRTGRPSTAARLPAHRFVATDGTAQVARVGRRLGRLRPLRLRRGRRALRLRPPRRPRPRHRPAAAGRADRLDRGRRDLDHPVRDLPGEHRQPGPAPGRRVPRRRHPRAHRPAPRPLARRRPDRAPQPGAVTRPRPGPAAAAAR